MGERLRISLLFLAVVLLAALVQGQNSVRQNNNNSSPPQPRQNSVPRKEVLDLDGKFVLEWSVNWNDQTITFNITAKSIGWVGFGLSNHGKMRGADIVIGGMYDNGRPYFSDRHAVANQVPTEDPSQDWTLLDCVESGTHTFLSIRRKLDTCDPQDYPITENRVSLIWAYGKHDREIRYHNANRGAYSVYLLDPSHSPGIVRDRRTKDPTVLDATGKNTPEDMKVWTISHRMRLPKNDTNTFCSMYRAPKLGRKHHTIGYDTHFTSIGSRDRVRNVVVYKCNVPVAGVAEDTTATDLFERFVGKEPQICYNLLAATGGPMPTHWCTELYVGWASGGRSFFNPTHVGFPLGNEDGSQEYYMVQVQYDNRKQDDMEVVFRMDLFYTSKLRPNEGGLMTISHELPGQPESFLIPPNSVSHRIYGHCSPECTRRMLGPGGKIQIYGGMLHSRTSGRRLRLHQFRRGQEMPWIMYDDNWSNDYQQVRNFREEREMMAGDQITVDCDFDSTWANGSTVVGGYAPRQETCLAYVFYYNKIWDYHVCHSQIVSEDDRKRFLAGAATVAYSGARLNWLVNDPQDLAGYTVPEVADNLVEWDSETMKQLQREHTLRPHQSACYRAPTSRAIPILPFAEGLSEDEFRSAIHYPLLDEEDVYRGPIRQCSSAPKKASPKRGKAPTNNF